MRPIAEIVSELGLDDDLATHYGKYKAKVSLLALDGRPSKGRLILVTGMTPTPHGEGKTVVSIGLAMGLGKLRKLAVACIRQPSLGPVFGIKGGGAGGGSSTLEPMQDVNMRLTGDIDAITSAHNLLAAAIDNHVFHGNALGNRPRGDPLAQGARRGGPGSPRGQGRTGGEERRSARREVHHHRRLRGHGDPLLEQGLRRPEVSAGEDGGGLHQGWAPGHGGGHEGRGRARRAA